MAGACSLPIYSMGFVVALAAVAFYYQAGAQEMDSGVPWAGMSAVISALVLFRWHGGMFAVLLAQLGLLGGIAVYRLWRDR
jgi:hypothetical protein